MPIGTTAALIAAGIAAAGSAAGSVIGSKSAKSAATQQQQSAQAALDEQKRQYDLTRADLAPWMTAGRGGLDQLTSGTAPGGALVTPYGQNFTAPTLDSTNDPGYAFRLQQGEQALKRAAAAGGGAFSGGTLAALTRYGQDYASNEYQNVYNRALTGYTTNANNYYTGQSNAFNRLAALAGIGQTATGTAANAGANMANNTADLLLQQGNAGAAGTLGTGSAINSGIQNGIGSFFNGGILSALTAGSNKPIPALPTQASRFNPLQLLTGVGDISLPAQAARFNPAQLITGYNG